MRRQTYSIEVSAWPEDGGWIVHSVRPDETHVAFGSCVSRRNVGKTAVSTSAQALNADASQIKLVKVEYIGTNRS